MQLFGFFNGQLITGLGLDKETGCTLHDDSTSLINQELEREACRSVMEMIQQSIDANNWSQLAVSPRGIMTTCFSQQSRPFNIKNFFAAAINDLFLKNWWR